MGLNSQNAADTNVENFTVNKSGAVTPIASEDPYLIKNHSSALPVNLGA